MGNPLLKNYNIDKDHFLTGGFNNLWKIYKGSRKDRKQDVCIFVLEKKILDKYPKEEKEEILNSLKKEAGALVKYKHPSILSIFEQVLEDKQTLIFVTEPVQYTLISWIETSGASKLEIKLMITEICHVLNFLHDDAHVIHGNLNPENIFIDTQGHIKLSGLGFSLSDPPINGVECKLNFSSPNSIPSLNYIAPEIVNDQMANYTSDIFSIGVIIYNVLKKYKNEDRDKELLSLNGSNTVNSYNRSFDSVSKILGKLAFENDDNEIIRKALNKTRENRPRIKDFLEHVWFNDPKLKALRFVENLEGNDAPKNNEFLNKFPQIINFFEPKIVERRFLPALMNALKVETLIVASLPAIFCICESANMKIDFEQAVWPGMKQLFQMKQLPAAALFYILSKLNFFSEKISNAEFSSNMLNIICKALDCNVPKIQSVVMDNISFVIKKIDSLAFKNQIYPRLINILLNTNSHSVKILILKSFTTIYSLLDHTLINESLLVNLEKIRKTDNSAEVCMCLTNIYEEIAKIVSIESIANKILPNLIAIMLAGNISRANFECIMLLVQKYLTRIKEIREKDLTDDATLTNSKPEMKDTNNLISMTSSKVGNGGDDFSFLNTFFGINSSSSNVTSSPNTNAVTSTDTKINLDFDFAGTQMTKPSGDIFTHKNGDSNFTAFKKTPLVADIPSDTTTKHKTQKSLFDGLTEKENKTNSKITNDYALNNLGFPQFGINENVLKPQTNNNRNNFDAFNFNMNSSNSLNSGLGNKQSQNNTLNLKKPTSTQEDSKKIDFNKPADPTNKANILDSLLDDITPGKTETKPSLSSKTNLNDWNFSLTDSNQTKANNNLNSGNLMENFNVGMNMSNTNINNGINKNNLGFDFDFTNVNSQSYNNPQVKNVNDYDFNLGMGNISNQGKANNSNNLNFNFNNSINSNKNKQSTNGNNNFNNDPFSGLNLTPNNNNNKTNEPTKNLLDGLLRF